MAPNASLPTLKPNCSASIGTGDRLALELLLGFTGMPGLFNALYKPLYERLMLGSIAAIQSASAILVTPFARAMLRV